jgi:hypothetical protein
MKASHFLSKYEILSNFNQSHTSRLPESGSGKRLQASEMQPIDSSHKISPNRVIFEKNSKKSMKKSPKFRFFIYLVYYAMTILFMGLAENYSHLKVVSKLSA